MYKSKLQELCQRERWKLPGYTKSKECLDHIPRYTATVTVCGQDFKSPAHCNTLKEAQNTAAQVAYNYLSTQLLPLPAAAPSRSPPIRLSRSSSPSSLRDLPAALADYSHHTKIPIYKNKLQELCQREKWELPSYAMAKKGPDHIPRYTATVTVCGENFESPPHCKTVKEAQNAAAQVAYNSFSTQLPPLPAAAPSPSPSPPRQLSHSPAPSSLGDPPPAAGMANYDTEPPSITIVFHELPYNTHNTYDVTFFGESIFTTVTSDSTIASKWISDVEDANRNGLHELIVGLDVEWRPNSKHDTKYHRVAMLQLCVGHRCLIFQLIHSPSVPPSLVEFLANPSYTFVGVGIGEDLKKLQNDYQFGNRAKKMDLRELAAESYGQRNLKQYGLKKLATLVLKKEIPKPKDVTLSPWDNLLLTASQVMYACLDAYVSFEIGRVLNASSSASASR